MALESLPLPALITAGAKLLPKPRDTRVTLVPRLVVLGDGTGAVIAFNLRLSNVGKEIAYGVQVGCPWGDLEANGSKLSKEADWWELHLGWGWRAVEKLIEYGAALPQPKRTSRALAVMKSFVAKRRVCRTKDVGLILAPGEQVDVYFGKYTLRADCERTGLLWTIGQLTSLSLWWHEGAPDGRFAKKRHLEIPFAIHSARGTETAAAHSALTAWTVRRS